MTTQNGHDHPSPTRTMTKPEPVRRSPQPQEEKSHSFVWLWFILFLVVLGVLVALVLWHKSSTQAALQDRTQQMAQPTVLVVKPQPGDAEVHLNLPGTVNSLIESSVYAQVSGYIKAWHFDIGAKVKAGDLLAEIDTPVTDQSLLQAGESVKQAQANVDLANVTAHRYNLLFATHAVSQQDVDNENAGVKVQEANLSAAKAFESGIEKTEAFKQVRAPFDGVITARRIDVGDFVSATGQTQSASAGTGPAQTGTPNQELFRVAQTKTLRIYVNVPENYSDETRPGVKATVVLASSPNQPVTGTLVRTSDAIDPNSLTLLTEIDVDNSDGKLLPGGYAQVHFDIVTDHPPLVIPGNALIFRQQGTQVGVVDMDTKTVHIKDIKIGRDLGTKLEITDGISADDMVILNPSDSLTEGAKVNVKEQPDSTQPKQP
jgi:multidrug efflux pump subunit AcrA (membrane-fusion protein)